jgi:hypothetical protein
MSMKDIAASGYTVEAESFKHLLPAEQAKELEDMLEDPAAGDEISELLNSCIPGIPPISEVFYFGGDDSSEDLELGKFYVLFDEEDLFETKPKPALLFLREKNVKPALCRWTNFG